MKKISKISLSGTQITLNNLHYTHNGYDCGYGYFKNKKKYDRKRDKKKYEKDILKLL